MKLSASIQNLLIATDEGGQLHRDDLWTEQSAEAIRIGLAKELKYPDSYTWIVLTESGFEAKKSIQ